MASRRSAVQFILTKVVACYLAMSVIVSIVFVLWSYHTLGVQRAQIASQLQNSLIETLAQSSPDEFKKEIDWLLTGVNASQSNEMLLQKVVLLDESNNVLFSWPEASEAIDDRVSLFRTLNSQETTFKIALTFSDTLLVQLAKQNIVPFIAVLLGQLFLLLMVFKYVIKRGVDQAFHGFMRELSFVDLRHPSPLQADSFLGQFGEYRQMLASVNRVILSLAKSRSEIVKVNENLEAHIQTKTTALEERNRELVELNQQLSIIANTDALTQVYNRTRFDVLFKEYVALSMRRDTPLAILLVDLDDFKKVNDQFGHQTGDHVLKHAAQVIQHQIGEEGIVARWGGEEFAVILPYFDITDAEQKAEMLRAAMAKARFEEQEIKVTTSIGVAQLGVQESAAQLLKRADDALYDAKGSGRNRVIIAYQEQSNTLCGLQEESFAKTDADLEPTECELTASQKLPA